MHCQTVKPAFTYISRSSLMVPLEVAVQYCIRRKISLGVDFPYAVTPATASGPVPRFTI